MRQTTQVRSREKKRRQPILLIVIIIVLVLLLIAGVAMRMAGWRGQRVEGTLTALVNPWNSVDAAGYVPTLTKVGDVEVDQSCASALEQMMNDCTEAGASPFLASGYISRASLEKNDALSLEDDAPGYSEHELGLAVDIRDVLTEEAGDSAVVSWLRENAWRYGFVLRYPEGSEEITGVPANPWHYRYVGEAAAAQIQQLDITLEEYVSMFYNDEAAVVFEK